MEAKVRPGGPHPLNRLGDTDGSLHLGVVVVEPVRVDEIGLSSHHSIIEHEHAAAVGAVDAPRPD